MRKKLFAILMSAMMMVTFMPSMAFATNLDAADLEAIKSIVGVATSEDTAVNTYFAANPHVRSLATGTKLFYTSARAADSKIRGSESTPATAVIWTNQEEKEESKIFALSKSYSNPNMAVDRIIHMGCGIDLEVWKCQTANCGYEEVVPNDYNAGLHKKATMEKMTAEVFIQKYLQQKVDEYLAENVYNNEAQIALQAAGKAATLAHRAAGIAYDEFMDFFAAPLDYTGDAIKEAFEGLYDALNSAPTDAVEAAGKVARAVSDALEAIMDVYYGTEDCFGLENVCFVMACVCPDCGIVLEDSYVVSHTTDTKACATHFTCSECKKEVWNVKNLLGKGTDHSTATIYRNTGKLGNIKVPSINFKNTDCATIASMNCVDCGEKLIALPIAKQNPTHDWEEAKPIVPATTLTKGVTADVCKNCGVITNVQLTEKKVHTHAVSEAKSIVVAATCTSPGYTISKCECGLILGVKDVKKPTGHTYKTRTLVKPTCDNRGYFEIYCDDCGSSKIFTQSKNPGKKQNTIAYLKVADDVSKTEVGEAIEEVNVNALSIGTEFKLEKIDELLLKSTEHIDCYQVDSKSGSLFDNKLDHDGFTRTYYFTGFGVLGLADKLLDPIEIGAVAKKTASATIINNSYNIEVKNEENKKYVQSEGHYYYLNGKTDLTKIKVTELKTGSFVKLNDATCTEAETWAPVCVVCGCADVHKASGKGLITLGKPLGHDNEVVEVAATCEHKAGTIAVCKTCGLETVTGFEEIPGGKCVGTGEYEVLKDATFTKAGTKVMYCKNCKQVCDYDDIAVKKLAKAYQPTLKAGKKQFTAKFKNIGDAATGVQIAYKVTGANNYKYVKTTFKKSKTIKNLKSGKKYTVKVRKYVVEDGKTIYGKWCAVKYVKVK